MGIRNIILYLFVLFPYYCYPQGEWNKWYCGAHVTIDFNSGVPMVLGLQPMLAKHTSASVSDSFGNILFYSNGEEVYNRNGNIMPNGSGLIGTYWTSQSVFAVKAIESDSIYYLFTNSGFPSWGLYYSVIDMSLDSGLGDIIPSMKNIPVPGAGNAAVHLTGTRHQNNRDAWVVTRKWGNDHQYAAYLVSSSGISDTPVLSNSNFLQTTPYTEDEGQMEISLDGTKLITPYDTFEMCSFNRITGEVTPLFAFVPQQGANPPYQPCQAAGFSVDSRFLYVMAQPTYNPPGGHAALYQYDATRTDSVEFMQSEILLRYFDEGNPDIWPRKFQLGPDNKIYCPEGLNDSIHVINNPSVQGIGCNFQMNAVGLAPGMSAWGCTPGFLQKYKAYIHYSGHCQHYPVQFSGDIWPPPDSSHWDFGDPASGIANYSNDSIPTHIYALPGQYTVELFVRHIDNRTDTSWLTITILETPAPDLGVDTTICQGDSVTFDAGFCPGCSYQWTSIPPGFTSTNQTVTLWQSGVYVVAVTSSNGCTGKDTVQLTITVPLVVTNNPLSKSICSGESTNIPLTSTIPGTNFSWTAIGSSPFVTGYSPGSGDTIDQVLTVSGSGPETVTYTITPAIGGCVGDSVQYVVTVTPGDSVLVSIAASADTVCEGTQVTFTASSTSGGSNPTYQWKVNANNAGINNAVFTYIPVNGDLISCILTNNEQCTTNNPATSNIIPMTVNPLLPVSVTISPSANPVCEGTPVTFTANAINGGTNPSYQWKVNANNAGINNAVYTYIPVNGDLISCILTNNEQCTTNNPDTSNQVIITVANAPEVTFAPCFDTITTTNAKPIRLKGGIPLGGTYSGPGVTNGYFDPSLAGPGTKTITYTYTNAALCEASANQSVFNSQPSILNCGDSLTDIRDNQKYPTVLIGTQCWMAANLNYGNEIPANVPQLDNCLPEKYVDSSFSVPGSAFYQWDEAMLYEETPGNQGICPPGWHIPTEADWNTLFANWTNNAFAGAPLKYSGYSGFNALLSGTGFFNRGWYFSDFATFFWSSTAHGPSKAWSHAMNDYDYSVSFYPSHRANAFSVRCLQD